MRKVYCLIDFQHETVKSFEYIGAPGMTDLDCTLFELAEQSDEQSVCRKHFVWTVIDLIKTKVR